MKTKVSVPLTLGKHPAKLLFSAALSLGLLLPLARGQSETNASLSTDEQKLQTATAVAPGVIRFAPAAAAAARPSGASARCLPMGPVYLPGQHHQRVALPPVEPAALEVIKKQHAQATQRLPVGFGRKLDQPVQVNAQTAPAGTWTKLANGWRLYSVALSAPGATGLRLHLEGLGLPLGARLLVYDPAKPQTEALALTAETLHGETQAWTETLFSEQVVLECQLPPGAAPQAVSFSLTEVSHLYRALEPQALALTTCFSDATCAPAWSKEASGVALIMFVDAGTTYVCTGCLLNTTQPGAAIDYFLTANHCVTDQTIASTLECYWFYQTSSCGGPWPSLYSVPQTGGGADLLATSSDNDFSFLHLRQPAPAGAAHLGWSTAAPHVGDTFACLHHANENPKQICFGALTDSYHQPGFWAVDWYYGVVDLGSSGSPLLNSSHKVIGQLRGGTADCSNPQGVSIYGRFDLTYNQIRWWIDPPYLAQAVDSVGVATDAQNPWFGERLVTHDGLDAGQSAPIGDSQQSRCYLTVAGPASVSFWWKVSSEAGADFLRFIDNGTVLDQISGEVGWESRTFTLGAGTHFLQWSYLKNADGAAGQDAGWLDRVRVTYPVAKRGGLDFDGDGKSDLTVYDSVFGNWYIRPSGGASPYSVHWGWSGATPVRGDFDGDGKSDLAVYDPATGDWYISFSSGSSTKGHLGGPGGIPVPGDYNGDGRTDLAVYYPAQGTWYIKYSGNSSATFNSGNTVSVQLGWRGTVAVPGDYDGDGATDCAIFDPKGGNWFVRLSGAATTVNAHWGWSGVMPVPGDYNGDGRTDMGLYYPANGVWYIKYSGSTEANFDTGAAASFSWGWAGVQPQSGDYDGDAVSDAAVFDPLAGNWYLRQSTAGPVRVHWGWNGAVLP